MNRTFQKIGIAVVSILIIALMSGVPAGTASATGPDLSVVGGTTNQSNNFPESPVCTSIHFCIAVGVIGSTFFVTEDIDGTWGSAQSIPGLSSLNQLHSYVSPWAPLDCWSDGNCIITGMIDGSPRVTSFYAFVSNGVIGQASLFNVSSLGTGDNYVEDVACQDANNCDVIGQFHHNDAVSYYLHKQNGTWGSALPLPGLSAISNGNDELSTGLSCSSFGNCTTTGSYDSLTNNSSVYVDTETDGVWANVQNVDLTGSGVDTSNANADLGSGQQMVSCSSPGNCSVLLDAISQNGMSVIGGFVEEVDGVLQVPTFFTAHSLELPSDLVTLTEQMDCPSANTCFIAGFAGQWTSNDDNEDFIITVTNGSIANISQVTNDNGNVLGIPTNISCPTTASCELFANEGPAGNSVTVAEYSPVVVSYQNSQVTSVEDISGFPDPTTLNSAEVWGICLTTTNCQLAGVYGMPSNVTQTVVGQISFATPVTTTSSAQSAPSSVGQPTVTLDGSTATVTFPPVNLGNLPAFYAVYEYANGVSQGEVCDVSVVTSCQVSNVPSGTDLTFVVSASNSLGTSTSPASAPVTYAAPTATMTTTTTAPTTPTTTTVPAPAKKTITCVKGKGTRKVAGLHPVCPVGYHKKTA